MREEQPARVRALDDPRAMVALWMIGTEDEPHRSAEICIFEVFGRDVRPDGALVGMGMHPFGDPAMRDEFERVRLPIDVRDAHDHAALWTPDHVAFYVAEQLVKVGRQSPAYPRPPEGYPLIFTVERGSGYRPVNSPGARPPVFAR
ncbi:hypothetical protein BH23CHL8_BH23CHL8_30250 [soil metagenome]